MAAPETKSKKPRILIADDSKVVLLTASRMLSNHFDIVQASDGLQAWEKLIADNGIQLVITDLGMPNMDGYELLKSIRKADLEKIRKLPVIIITGNSDDENIKKKVLELGATDFITKPFMAAEFIARLQAHASYQSDRSVLQESVNIDLLTGTLNRKALTEKLEVDISFVSRHGQNLVVILFEVDNYDIVIEKAGQKAADKVVKSISKALISAIRREDSFGRYTASCFMTILPMAKIDGVVMLVKRLCAHIKGYTFKIGDDTYNFTISAGIASVPKGCPTDANAVVNAAEQALSNAHSLGVGEFQLLKLENSKPDDVHHKISIDNLLDILVSNERALEKAELLAAEKRLEPLLALFTKQQKKRISDGFVKRD